LGVVYVFRSYYPVLALTLCDGLSPSDCFKLPGEPRRAFELLLSGEGRRDLSFLIRKPVPEVPWAEFDAHLEAIERSGAGVVTCLDDDYPECFREIPRSPSILFFRGDRSLLSTRGVAIVGSRRASARGAAFTRSLAADLASIGVTVVSGAARGIDASAHRGTLDVEGRTVAVLGTGVDVPYPRENEGLIDSIADSGCVVTERLMGGLPLKHVFPMRNRLISALSRAVVVVEAAQRSGALITANWALEQGRDVGAVPGFPGDGRSRGGNALLKMGAFPVEGVDDIISAVPILNNAGLRRGKNSAGKAAPELSENARRVLGALSASPADPDSISRYLGLSASEVLNALLELEMKGLVERERSGLYASAPGGCWMGAEEGTVE
jgi:DNA processing protein